MTNELAQQQIEWEQLLAAKNAEIERLRVCWAEALENVATRNREIEQLMKERHQLRNELTAARLENQRLQEVLTIPNITPDTTSSALFIRTLSEHEKGQPVNGQDLINALMWRVKNQRKEIARLQEKRGSSEPNPQVSLGPVKVGADLHQCEECGWMKFTPVGESTPEARHRNLCACQACLQERGREAIDNALKSVSAHLPNQAQWCQDPDCPQCASQRT